MYLSMVCDQQF